LQLSDSDVTDSKLYAGNRVIHLLTNDGCGSYELRVDLKDFSGRSSYAEYDNFKIGSEYENYKLASLGTYKGTAGMDARKM